VTGRPRYRDTVLGIRIVTPAPYTLRKVRCGRCSAEWETTGRETSRCQACGRNCRLSQAVTGAPNVVPLRRRQ
jgi:tRNA(Ile2) C34 agmatinyltransferase TiaS